MSRAYAGEVHGLGRDRRAEVVATIGALLLEVVADCGQDLASLKPPP